MIRKGVEDWIGCRLDKCPYGKEYGDCDTCEHLIRSQKVSECEKLMNEIEENRDKEVVVVSTKNDLFSRQAIEEINSEIPKIHELFDIAYKYNQEDSTRTELSQKCTTYLLDVWQTLGAIVDNYSPAENKEDTVSRAAYEQIKWERDIAIQQLKDLGYDLGEKPRENTGEWISTKDHPELFCSKCGRDADEADTPYCPYCGAKMTWVGAIHHEGE